jgi:predicted PurR-regulated permease PerM
MGIKKNPIGFSTRFFITVIGLVVIFMVFKELQDIFIPFVLAFLMYFVFAPLNNFLNEKKFPGFAVVIVDFLILVFIFGGVSIVIVDSFMSFGANLPKYEGKLNSVVSATARNLGLKYPELINFQVSNVLKSIDYKLIAGNIFFSTFNFLEYFFLVIFFFIFIESGQKSIYEAIRKRYTGEEKQESNEATDEDAKVYGMAKSEEPAGADSRGEGSENTSRALDKTFLEITTQIQKYVVSKFYISLITGIVEGGVVFLFGVEYALVWAVLIFLFNFIPAIGSFISLVLPCLMALLQFDSVIIAIVLAGVLFILDTIIGNYVEPKVFGQRLGLSPIVVLLSLLVWGYVWGIIGMLLSVPLTSIVKIIISRSKSPNMKLLNDLISGEAG